MGLSEADLELINAFHDGELDRHATAAVERRLANEPALRVALEDISEISRALGALRPSIIPEREATPPAIAAPGNPATAGIGASAALIVLLVTATMFFAGHVSEAPPSPSEWHRLFVAQEYQPASSGQTAPAAHWIGQIPDLSSARLTFVDAAGTVGDEFYLHYSGVNGCRLTFGIHSRTPSIPEDEPGLMARNWAARDRHYSLLAVGMDRHKFETIAKLLVQETETGNPGGDSLLAVREATRTAVPCA